MPKWSSPSVQYIATQSVVVCTCVCAGMRLCLPGLKGRPTGRLHTVQDINYTCTVLCIDKIHSRSAVQKA